MILPNLKRKLQQINRNENLLYEAIIHDVALLTAELSTMSRVQISIYSQAEAQWLAHQFVIHSL